jgi:hypothetical protein
MTKRRFPWDELPRHRANLTSRSRSAKDEAPQKNQQPRVLQELTFYWIPGDTKNGTRKTQMDRAREFGAKVEGTIHDGGFKEWSESVTHIIVDSRHPCDYAHVLTYLGANFRLSSIPDGIPIVTEIGLLIALNCLPFRYQRMANTESKVSFKPSTAFHHSLSLISSLPMGSF